jgi:superfamily II DNA/RNA helicase
MLTYAGMPLTVEAYVHRIGRCGRAGRHGVAHSLFTQQDAALAAPLAALLAASKQARLRPHTLVESLRPHTLEA